MPQPGFAQAFSASGSGKVRVVVLLNTPSIMAWQACMLERIAASDYAEIVAVISDASVVGDGATAASERSVPRRLLRIIKRALTAFRDRLDGTMNIPDPFVVQPLPEALSALPQLALTPERNRVWDSFAAADIERIREFQPDVIVRLGFRILRGAILGAAKCGVWSFHHGDNRVKRGLPPGFWEVWEREPVIGTTLQILSEQLDGGLVLARTYSAVYGDSVPRTTYLSYWKSLSLLPRQLQRLQRLGATAFLAAAHAASAGPDFYSHPLYRQPTPSSWLHLWMRTMLRGFQQRMGNRFFPRQWCLLVSEEPERADSLRNYRRILPPRGWHWADPFVWQRDGRTCIFVEEQEGDRAKGFISVVERDSSGAARSTPVITSDWHMSFPFLLEREGTLYMVPESRAANCISLYRCVEFPHRWERLPDLMSDVSAVDTVIVSHGGRWWMFTTVIENPGSPSTDELFLFHSDTFPSQQWTPHPLNPIVSDVRHARAAGGIFKGRDGQLYRPSQDCSQRYGWAINFNRIDRLDAEGYGETIVSRVTPSWARDVIGVHTYNRHGNAQVFDAYTAMRA